MYFQNLATAITENVARWRNVVFENWKGIFKTTQKLFYNFINEIVGILTPVHVEFLVFFTAFLKVFCKNFNTSVAILTSDFS